MDKRKYRADGGEASLKENGGEGRDGEKSEEGMKNKRYTYESNVNDEAEERKFGGKAEGKGAKKHAGRRPRGAAMHEVANSAPRKSGGRAKRASGGRTGSDQSPFSSARSGIEATGRNVSGSRD